MPLLGFRKVFALPVERGDKLTTIRAPRRDGLDPKVGDRLYLYTGLRTKGARKLGEGIVTSRRRIRIEVVENYWFVRVDGEVVNERAFRRIYRADGFASRAEFFLFFERTHGRHRFVGFLYRWKLDPAARPDASPDRRRAPRNRSRRPSTPNGGSPRAVSVAREPRSRRPDGRSRARSRASQGRRPRRR